MCNNKRDSWDELIELDMLMDLGLGYYLGDDHKDEDELEDDYEYNNGNAQEDDDCDDEDVWLW